VAHADLRDGHGELGSGGPGARGIFRVIRPACTLVAVKGLVDPAMLVEIEAEGSSSRVIVALSGATG